MTRTVLREAVDAARVDAARQLADGAGGRTVARGLAAAADRIVLDLVASALGPGALEKAGIALLATGGWGRHELCPYSDLDLLFLTPDEPDDAARELAEKLLYPLWDSGMEIGHAMRSVPDALGLAQKDLPTATALADARLLGGDPARAEELERGFRLVVSRPGDPNAFVRRLREEMHARHARFGDSPFLLEPNLKHGRGALRDLTTATWAARARFGAATFSELLPRGRATPRQVAALDAAHEFLLGLRTELHLAAHRRQDTLTFALQEELAPRRLGAGAAVTPAVEELMREVYLHARAVVREADRLLERATVPPHRAPLIRRLEATWVSWNGALSAAEPSLLRTRPSELIRVFRVALDTGLPIYGHTKELIAEIVAEPGAGERLALDDDARRHLAALIADERDARTPSLVEEAHELGVLTAAIPELAPCTGRVQHDLYHVYTVDQHQLLSLALWKRIARGELGREAPRATEAAALVPSRRALALALLVHDVGKPLGKGHAEKGAKLAAQIARRFHFPDSEVQDVELYVRHHLAMMHLSQRRDLDDDALIARFAKLAKDEGRLAGLYLMGYVDMATTAPGNLTAWKLTLLDDLFERTRTRLRRGTGVGDDRSSQLKRKRRRTAQLLVADGVAEATAHALAASLPDRYVSSVEPRVAARHAALCHGRGGRPIALATLPRPSRGVIELLVVAPDAPGLLARFAGVMHAHRLDVVGALIATRDAGAGVGREALDVFTVRPPEGGLPEARWRALEDDLAAVLSGQAELDALVRTRRPPPRTPPARKTPWAPTQTSFDNEVAADYTVVDVATRDAPGVLFAITRTLSDAGLDIFLSRVATEADRVTDIFYVRDRETGQKVVDPERLARLATALTAALDGGAA